MKYLNYIKKGLKPKNFYNITKTSLFHALNKRHEIKSNDVHIKAAMEWLSIAQKQNNDGGVAAYYSLFDGWLHSYVETTGYIIPTFFNYAEATEDDKYRNEAVQMADFELKVQMESGAFPGETKNGVSKPIVFNTGQVIFGLCRAYEETNEDKYKQAVEKAADWLLSVMHEEGYWQKDEYLNEIHTYNTRTAWALLRAHEITKTPSYRMAAIKNLDWASKQQMGNGFLNHNGFFPAQEPLVHTIAYSIRGFLESAIYLRKKTYLNVVIKAADSMINKIRKDGSLPGSFDKDWNSSVKWSCLTGNSQMSIIYQKLFTITKDTKYQVAFRLLNDYMKSVQNLDSKNDGIRGGIPGAYPIYGWYAPFCYPNWAAKFFADSLMMEENPKIKLNG